MSTLHTVSKLLNENNISHWFGNIYNGADLLHGAIILEKPLRHYGICESCGGKLEDKRFRECEECR